MSAHQSSSTMVLPMDTTNTASMPVIQENLSSQENMEVHFHKEKYKKMVGWKSLVEDEEHSFSLLLILLENKAHTTDHKKDYDDLIRVVFDGQLNSDGQRNGNALFHQYQEWTVNYSNRKMKSLCNGVIDYFADDSTMCEIEELHGLAKKLKEDRNAVLVE